MAVNYWTGRGTVNCTGKCRGAWGRIVGTVRGLRAGRYGFRIPASVRDVQMGSGVQPASYWKDKVKVKWSRYRPGLTHRVSRGIALLFHDRGTRRGWVVSSTSRPHFTLGKDPVPNLHEAGWAPGPIWTGGNSRPHRDSIPDGPACGQSLYRLSYLTHTVCFITILMFRDNDRSFQFPGLYSKWN